MEKFKPVLIRAIIVVLVAAVVRVFTSGFDFDGFIDQLIYVGLPMFLGLLVFSAVGPNDGKKIHKAMYPALYGWVVFFILTNVFDSNQARSTYEFWEDGIRIPIGFVLAVPTLYVLDLVWKPKPKQP